MHYLPFLKGNNGFARLIIELEQDDKTTKIFNHSHLFNTLILIYHILRAIKTNTF